MKSNVFSSKRIRRKKAMRILLVFLLMIGGLACKKSKEEDTLPKPLQDIVANFGPCNCTSFIDKYELVTDNPPHTDVLYLMSCEGIACTCTTVIYDKNGQITTLPPTHHLVFVKRVWECKP
jgi:hypothetical protein